MTSQSIAPAHSTVWGGFNSNLKGLDESFPFDTFAESEGMPHGVYWFSTNGNVYQFEADGFGFVLVGTSAEFTEVAYTTVAVPNTIQLWDNQVYDSASMIEIATHAQESVKIKAHRFDTGYGDIVVEQAISDLTILNLVRNYDNVSNTGVAVELGSVHWTGNTANLDRTCNPTADQINVRIAQACSNNNGIHWFADNLFVRWDYSDNVNVGGLTMWLR